MITYGAEAMILTKDSEEKRRRFERKIYSPKREVEGVSQKLINSKVQERLQAKDTVKAIKAQRLEWCGYIRRMGEENVVKKATETLEDQREDRKVDGRSRH